MTAVPGAVSRDVVLILGGTSGFGLAIARQLAGSAKLVLAGRDGSKARRIAADFEHAAGYGLDARDAGQLTDLLKRTGPVTHVVSMLGGAMGGGFLSADPATIRETVEGKFFDNITVARTVAPYIAGGGSLTLTAGSGGRPDNASGAIVGNLAVSALVKGLAVEMAPSARVNAVAPTWTPTPLWRDLPKTEIDATERRFAENIPLGRVARPAEVAEAYVFLMRCGFITGQTLTVDGGLTLVA